MSKRMKIIKMALSIFLVILLSINNYAAIVSDNDGSAFITKAEFDALKTNFAKQVDDYNSSIDSKIDGAIASYLSGMLVSSKTTLDNNYTKLKTETPFLWGKGVTNQSSKLYGGHVTHIEIGDTKSTKKSTLDVSNNVTMYCLASDQVDCKNVHMNLYKEVMTYYESVTFNFFQGSTWTNHKLTVEECTIINGIKGVHPKRDGTTSRTSAMQTGAYPEAGSAIVWIVEKYEPDKTKIPVFSIDNAANEYILPMTGYTDTLTSTKTTEDKKSSFVGDFTLNQSQPVRKEVYINWAQAIKHNDLIVYEWAALTGQDEKIKSGIPVIGVEKKGKLEFSVKATENGTLYAYSTEFPQECTTLADNGNNVRVISLTAGTEEKIEMKECEKNTYLRIGFLPAAASTTADLDFTSDIILTFEN